MIIGEKKEFAIELNLSNDISLNRGFAKVWFGNNSFGTLEDEIYLKGYLFEGLKSIIESEEIDFDVEGLHEEEIFNTMKDSLKDYSDDNIHNYLINFGSFCEDFTIFSYKNKGERYVLWKLNSNNTPFEDLNSQSLNINSYKINKDKFYQVFINYFSIIYNRLI